MADTDAGREAPHASSSRPSVEEVLRQCLADELAILEGIVPALRDSLAGLDDLAPSSADVWALDAIQQVADRQAAEAEATYRAVMDGDR